MHRPYLVIHVVARFYFTQGRCQERVSAVIKTGPDPFHAGAYSYDSQTLKMSGHTRLIYLYKIDI